MELYRPLFAEYRQSRGIVRRREALQRHLFITSRPPKALILAPRQEEWEIRKIVSKRRAGKGYEAKVRWKDTWLPGRELGNAKQLLREFEARWRLPTG